MGFTIVETLFPFVFLLMFGSAAYADLVCCGAGTGKAEK